VGVDLAVECVRGGREDEYVAFSGVGFDPHLPGCDSLCSRSRRERGARGRAVVRWCDNFQLALKHHVGESLRSTVNAVSG
jgi:hypothetical protein